MKRDLDHIRRILLEVEAAPLGSAVAFEDNADAFQAALAVDANLLLGLVVPDAASQPCFVQAFRLTWSGADFLDATRDSDRWRTFYAKLGDKAIDFTFDAVISALTTAAKFGIQQIL